MLGKRPERKPFGPEGPPKGYPKDQSVYADPENWRYPLHTLWHARAARRYFDEWSNRSKYTEEERAYIDWHIDQALKKFETTARPGESRRHGPKVPSRKKIEELSLEELLRLFLGVTRFARISEIEDAQVAITEATTERIKGQVKDYVIQIDLKKRTILHDCQDWRKNMDTKNMCKHLGKFLMNVNADKATDLLRDILKNKDAWTFIAP